MSTQNAPRQILTPDERYQTDPAFNALVKTLYAAIRNADFTPTEIRQAAMLAQIHYENERLPRYILDAAEKTEAAIRERHICDFCNFLRYFAASCRRMESRSLMAGLGLDELIRRIGNDHVKIQFLQETLVSATQRKRGFVEISFLTKDVSVASFMQNDPETIGIVVWVPYKDFRATQASWKAEQSGVYPNPDNEHLAANGKPIDGYPKQQV